MLCGRPVNSHPPAPSRAMPGQGARSCEWPLRSGSHFVAAAWSPLPPAASRKRQGRQGSWPASSASSAWRSHGESWRDRNQQKRMEVL